MQVETTFLWMSDLLALWRGRWTDCVYPIADNLVSGSRFLISSYLHVVSPFIMIYFATSGACFNRPFAYDRQRVNYRNPQRTDVD